MKRDLQACGEAGFVLGDLALTVPGREASLEVTILRCPSIGRTLLLSELFENSQ